MIARLHRRAFFVGSEKLIGPALVTLSLEPSRRFQGRGFAAGQTLTLMRSARPTVRLLRSFPGRVHTLASDNGREFAGHHSIAKTLGAKLCFAHPRASWERGSNENSNGLIQQYFPKETDFPTVTFAPSWTN